MHTTSDTSNSAPRNPLAQNVARESIPNAKAARYGR